MASTPFVPEPEAVSRWLSDLDGAGIRSRARSLYEALRELNETSLDGKRRLSLLETLRQPVFAASELLARESVRSPVLWQEASRNTAKLSAFLHHELAAGYESLSGPLARQRAIASLGQMILRIIQIGEPVSSGVWRRLYRCYSEARRQGWEEEPVAEPLLQRQISPLRQFQWVLGFVALTPMRFDPSAMGGLFALLQSGIVEVRFSASAAGWCFDPGQPKGPCRADRAAQRSGSVQYLSLSLAGCPESIDEKIWLRLQHHVGQPAEAAYPVERRVDELWLGWETIVTELSRRRNRRQNVGWLEVPEFELSVPDGFDPISTEGGHIQRRLGAVLKQSRDGERALLETEIAIAGADLVALKFLDGGLQLAVVRWVHPGWFGNPGHFGLDLFVGRSVLVKAIVPRLGPSDVILVSREGEGDVLLLPPVKLKPGTEMLVDAGEARVARLLEWTESFCAYRLVP